MIGRRVSEFALERQRAHRAEHAKRRRIIGASLAAAAIIAAAVFVASRSAMTDPSERGAMTPSATSARPGATSVTNARGNIPKKLGELAGFGSADSPDQNTFVIDSITLDPPCAPRGTKPDSGHTVLLHVTVHTGDDKDRAAMLGRILQPGFFSAIDSAGTTHDAWPGECTNPADKLPSDFTTNRKYTGTVELRLAARTGALVLAGDMDNAAGWEWKY